VHYASLCGFEGAEEAVRQYNEDPKTDYHQWTADLCGITRKAAKFINLGLAYGMGKRKLAAQLGYISEADMYDHSVVLPPEVEEIFEKYHAGVPYVRKLQESCSRQAEKNKFVRTHWGRRRHFNLVEKAGRRGEHLSRPMPLEEFKAAYPGERWTVAFTHKALNAVIQGSSADHMKEIMLQLGDASYVMNLTVHDEVDSAEVTSQRQFDEVQDIMVGAIKLRVPIVVDGQLVDNWGEAK
jgi:DNA polymerase I-like protein with 3'-5' exonuclease and polymerase domains